MSLWMSLPLVSMNQYYHHNPKFRQQSTTRSMAGAAFRRHDQPATQDDYATTMKKTIDGVMMALITCIISSQLHVFLKSNHPLRLLLLFVAHSICVVRHFLLVSTHDCLAICTGTLESQFGPCIAINKTNDSVSGGYHRPFEA